MSLPSIISELKIGRVLAGSFTANFSAARFLLKPGRTFEQAVEKFQPYTEVKEPNPEIRMARFSHPICTVGPAWSAIPLRKQPVGRLRVVDDLCRNHRIVS